ncbi:NAD-dependent epimerase/dehydratase family protein [Gracilibacillus sp. YIM 98692]|uniref:NAD-dependent epimerase/dehydratase family protein n=1 Tax=Gracilibacillus sp. YIM 98692 TaxID=2663532 RepID=UPI0013D7E5E8|nr:NAD-dependent epimerase/dehydratase family protein [Gracilibacillus sp. YIM 98692]
MKVLVIGGTGVISREVVKQLAEANHHVIVFSRGNKKETLFQDKVEHIYGDKGQKQTFMEQMHEVDVEIVIDMISFHEEDARTTLEAFSSKAEQIIFTSSVAAYQRPYPFLPAREAQLSLTKDPSFRYAYEKAEMERYLQQKIKEESLPITIIRPSLTFGVGGMNVGVLRQNVNIVHRIEQGKPLVLFGDGTTPWNFTFVPDLAKAYVGLVGNKEAYGEDFHITNEEHSTWKDLYEAFGKAVHKEPEIVYIPSSWLYEVNTSLFDHIYYEKCYAGLFDNAKLRKVLPDYEATISLEKGIQMMVQWYKAEQKLVDQKKAWLEDLLVAFHHDSLVQIKNIGKENAR